MPTPKSNLFKLTASVMLFLLMVVFIVLALAGCEPNPTPPQAPYFPQAQVQQQPVYQQPQVVQAPAQSNTGELLLAAGAGALAGHLLTKKDAPAAAAPTQVINRNVIVKQVVPPTPAALPAAIVPATAQKPATAVQKPAATPIKYGVDYRFMSNSPTPPRPSYAPSYKAAPTRVTYRGK